MVGCDGGKSSARAAVGVLDQHCRIPPPAGSQGCRIKPSDGRSGGFADVGLALDALGGRAALAVQGQPGQQPVTQGVEAGMRPRTTARTRPVNLQYESGTRISEKGAVVFRGRISPPQHVVPDVDGDANAELEDVIPPSLRSGVAGRPKAMAGCSPAPVWTTVARALASVGSTAGEDRSGPQDKSMPMKTGRTRQSSRAIRNDMTSRRHSPSFRQACQPQSSQNVSPPGAILGRPSWVGFGQPPGDLRGVSELPVGDLADAPARGVKSYGRAPVIDFQPRGAPGHKPCQRAKEGEDRDSGQCRCKGLHEEACISAPGWMILTSCRSGRTSRTGHKPFDSRSSLIATSAEARSRPFSMSETCARERRPI